MGHQQPHHQWEERPGELGLWTRQDFFFCTWFKKICYSEMDICCFNEKNKLHFFTAVGNVCLIVSFKKQKNNNCRLKLHNIDLSYEGHCECTFHTCNHVPML